jgi:hypothetical protein
MYANYESAGLAGQPSPSIWASCPVDKALLAPEELGYVFDDFVDPVAADSSIPNWELAGTNADIDNVADVVNGQILMQGSGTDNDSCTILKNDMYLLTKNSGKRFWFEASVKPTNAGTADDYALFVGLIESVGATAEMIADDGASIIDEDFVGFAALTNATTIQDWDAVINIGGSANFPVTVEADAGEIGTSYIKLGMVFDGQQTVTFYVDGAVVATYDIDNLDSDTMSHEFTVALGVKQCEATAALGMYADWVRFAYDKQNHGR